jgi:hypothetical protein
VSGEELTTVRLEYSLRLRELSSSSPSSYPPKEESVSGSRGMATPRQERVLSRLLNPKEEDEEEEESYF